MKTTKYKGKGEQKQLIIHSVVKSFYCQTERCDKTKNKQCDECALQELNGMQ